MGGYAGQLHQRLNRQGLEVAETSYRADQHVPPHTHARPLIVAVLAGTMTEHATGRSVRCSPGEALFHPAGEVHAHDFGADRSRCLSIQVDEGWLERLSVERRRLPSDHVVGRDQRITGAARLLHSELSLGAGAISATLDGLVLRLLSSLAQAADLPGDRRPRFLRPVLDRLHDDCAGDLHLASLAELAGVSPEHLARTFRRETGLTVGQYVRRLRVERALHALDEGHDSLSRLALELGFSDQSHFTRVFRSHVGCTPGRYQRSRRRA